MTGPDRVAAARELLEDLERPGRIATGLDVIQLLTAWGFTTDPNPIDPEMPDQVVFMVHPRWSHLQMDIPSLGRVHRWVVGQAVGLARSAWVCDTP